MALSTEYGPAATDGSPLDTLRLLHGFVETQRLPMANEKAAQAALERALQQAGIDYEREPALGDGDIPDFIVQGVVIEMKLKGGPMDTYRQVERYARHERVVAILLLTSRAMGLPAQIEGKPAAVASIGKGWL